MTAAKFLENTLSTLTGQNFEMLFLLSVPFQLVRQQQFWQYLERYPWLNYH